MNETQLMQGTQPIRVAVEYVDQVHYCGQELTLEAPMTG